jgi:hypothetical protein
MSVKKFKFVSPGIFLSEVDNSQLPAIRQAVGPVIIGRTRMGPSMRPYRIESPSEFVQVFGNPVAGGGSGGDVWREGNLTGPTYASYAAMAYLKAGVGPITMVRLLGEENSEAVGTGDDIAFAGWRCKEEISTSFPLGGPYGIFLFPSGSEASETGTLGAIIYANSGAVLLGPNLSLSSSEGSTVDNFAGYAAVMESEGENTQFHIEVFEAPGPVATYRTSFNFNRDDELYIRNVLNTNPQLVNSAFVSSSSLKQGEQYYWLGETFEQDVIEACGGLDVRTRAVFLPLATGSTLSKDDYKINFQYAKTGYFFSQDLASNVTIDDGGPSYVATNMTKLFRFVALDGGRWVQDKFKISIQDIKASTNTSDPYGSFNIILRAASDRDNVVQVVERYSNVNLNPVSENYIARVMGDTYYDWDSDQKVLRQYGQYANKSKYIRVDMNDTLEVNMDARLLPFGVTGPLRFKSIAVTSGSSLPVGAFAKGSGSLPSILATAPEDFVAPDNGIWMGDTTVALANLQLDFPKQLVRVSASDGGLADPTDAYFGVQTTQGKDSSRFDPSYGDYLWRMPDGVDLSEDTLSTIPGSSLVEYSWVVSLDDVVTTGSATAYWQSGSRALGSSSTAQGSWQSILNAGYNRITAPLYGGFNGLDIREAEPFRNGLLDDGGNLDTENYAFNSIKRAIDTVKDPEFVECNIITVPGVTNESLTQHLIDICEDRADALAIIDLPKVYTPFTDSPDSFESRDQDTVKECIDNLKERGINSSYGCAYYPWVQILDTISNNLLWAPPSVVALGTLASSEAKSEVWFAPAGFNRGGLTDGAAGWPVLNVTRRLTSKDRDNLYEANINPIASFPSEGIVVFGQKTLQVTRSALDRINVRRLLIYIKKQVSRIASGILFDQNVQVTWNRFLGEVRPFLASVQSRLGLSEWKVILDSTTTTPDLIDQNIMYAKIFLKPARAIEFIAVDFVITRTGASFDD